MFVFQVAFIVGCVIGGKSGDLSAFANSQDSWMSAAAMAQVSTVSLSPIGFTDDDLQGEIAGSGADGTTYILSGIFDSLTIPFTSMSTSNLHSYLEMMTSSILPILK